MTQNHSKNGSYSPRHSKSIKMEKKRGKRWYRWNFIGYSDLMIPRINKKRRKEKKKKMKKWWYSLGGQRRKEQEALKRSLK